MDHSIRRRVANDDLTSDEAEDLEWEQAESNGEDRNPAPVAGTGSPTASDQEHAKEIQKSLAKSARLPVDTASAPTKSLNSLQTSLGTLRAKPGLDMSRPFDWS